MVFLVLQYLLIFILFLLLMILFIPLVYSLDGIKEEYYFFSFRISWLWKVFNIVINKEENQKADCSIVIFGFRIPINDIGKRKKRGKTKFIEKQKRLKKGNARYLSLLNQSFLKQLFILIGRLLQHVLPKKIRVHLIYGCADPADTGMLAGIFTMVLPYIQNSDKIVTHRPVFDEEVILGEISFKGRIVSAVIVYYFLQFYFARGIRQTIKIIRTK